MIGEVATKHIEVLPVMVPALISFLKDETPAVVRQAIKTGTFLFQYVLVKLAIKVIVEKLVLLQAYICFVISSFYFYLSMSVRSWHSCLGQNNTNVTSKNSKI